MMRSARLATFVLSGQVVIARWWRSAFAAPMARWCSARSGAAI